MAKADENPAGDVVITGRGAWLSWWTAVIIPLEVVVIAALGAALIVLVGGRSDARAEDIRREAFVAAASQTVINMTTLGPDTAVQDVERLLAGSSGDFREEFSGREEDYTNLVAELKVTSTGKVIETAVVRLAGPDAVVLVAAQTAVSSATAPEPAIKDFRLRITLHEAGSAITATKVEFVP